MATFAELKTRVEDYVLENADSTVDLVGAWINKAIRDAEAGAYSFHHMEAEEDYTTTENTRELGALPARWKRRRGHPWYTTDDGATTEIYWATSKQDMVRRFALDDTDDDGSPLFLLENGSTLEVYPYPDGDSDHGDGEYRLTVPYWRFSAELSADGDTSVWTTDWQWYTTFQAVAEGMLFNRDENAATFVQYAAQQLRRVMTEDKRARLTTGPTHLSIKPTVYGTRRVRRKTLRRRI